MKMAWLRVFSCLLVALLVISPILASICPDGCVCNTTRDGLHRATCSSLDKLYKFSLRQKHHNINILNLSHNNITKLSHELDRLTEVVTIDLSTNGIQNLNKFLHNAKKLVHLNLANNRIKMLSLTVLPTSVSSLDLTNNLLHDVPSDLWHLNSLEHLELEGNPLDCSCENLIARDRLLSSKVHIDDVKCVSPTKYFSRSWLELKTKDLCKLPKTEFSLLDMMMGDQPIDAVKIGEEAESLKTLPQKTNHALGDGNVIQGESGVEDDDSVQFLKVGGSSTYSSLHEIEGSGEVESTTISEIFFEGKNAHKLDAKIFENDEIIPVDDYQTTEDPIEGSGEGSGDIFLHFPETTEETTTPVFEELNPGPVRRIFEEEPLHSDRSSTEFPIPEPPSVYQGGADWNSDTPPPSSTEKIATSSTSRDTTVSEQIRVTQASEVLGQVPTESSPTPHKTGTYVCIAIIVILLVGLIGFAIIKGQMRKRRDRRLMRQQKRDVEKASKEMVDMNKSLLGKPSSGLENPSERKTNGKYELVPTHDAHQKKSENGDVGNGINHGDKNGVRTDSPRDSNQNKNSSKDNNIAENNKEPQQETSFDSTPGSSDSKKDTHSLSSEDIFVPANDEDIARLNGNAGSEASQPLINDEQTTDSDFLSPSREYVPVYSPDMGRVRIKMTETPKPKTPVLVTRSRSNAGDIIITPAGDANARKSTT